MKSLKPNDIVVCMVKDFKLVSPYAEYDSEISLTVISVDDYGCYVYLPDNIYIKPSTKITDFNIKTIGCDKKFVDSFYVFVENYCICKIISGMQGMYCSGCREYVYQAESNQSDDSFICWSCRNYKYRHKLKD